MIDLTQSRFASPRIHAVAGDPGVAWVKDAAVVIEPPPDGVAEPLPETRWPTHAIRTGSCGVVSPRVVRLRSGEFRLFYSQILPRAGCPAGANDYDNASSRILSASSPDGQIWTPEPGIRLTPQQGGAGEYRVVSSEVVPIAGEASCLRMYFECCPGPQTEQNSICSAVSDDEGLTWSVEPGVRFAAAGQNFMAPRIVFLDDRRSRLYCCQNGVGIVSAVSDDGVDFRREPGVRIAQGGENDRVAAFACDIMVLPYGGYVMYYAGYAAANRAHILRAESHDGLLWRKVNAPVVSPGSGAWDVVKSSEVSLYHLPGGAEQVPRFRMVYEACDGTAAGERGVWRIASATSA